MQQNELLVKRYLRKGDIYVHADLHGASTTILKNHQPDSPSKTLLGAASPTCNAAIAVQYNLVCQLPERKPLNRCKWLSNFLEEDVGQTHFRDPLHNLRLSGATSKSALSHPVHANSLTRLAVPQLSIQQAGNACVCRSQAWDAKIVTSAWWVHHDQVLLCCKCMTCTEGCCHRLSCTTSRPASMLPSSAPFSQ